MHLRDIPNIIGSLNDAGIYPHPILFDPKKTGYFHSRNGRICLSFRADNWDKDLYFEIMEDANYPDNISALSADCIKPSTAHYVFFADTLDGVTRFFVKSEYF